MDAGRRRRLAWRRRRRTGTDAGLPALDRLAARARAGTIGERLSGTRGYSPRWAGACPARQLRNRVKCDRSPVADELPRRAFEGWGTLELPAGRRAHCPLDSPGDGFRSGPGRAATGRAGGLQAVERRDRIRGPIRCRVRTWLGCPAWLRACLGLPLRAYKHG